MSKEQWITELERLVSNYSEECYQAKQQVLDAYIKDLVGHGLNDDEARKMLEEADA